MIVIPKEEAYESVRNRVWYPPACDNKEEHIKFLFKGCQEMDIVFCKDCRHAYFKDFDKYCPYMVSAVKPDGYCSHGERERKMTDRIKQCEVVDNCEDCPRYADDCDGEIDDE